MKNITLRQWINLLAVLGTIVVNGLANSLPINNQTTGEISDSFEVLFVPAGYVFSIWGLIYLGQLAFGIYQFLPAQRDNPRLNKIGYLPAVASLANMSWIILWHYNYFVLTMLVMLILLVSLIAIYIRLDIGKQKASAKETWLINVPFSIYLGWITVATIANATALLDYLEWGRWGLSPEFWTVIMLATGVIVTSLMALTRGDIPYLLVLIWAFSGIAVKFTDNPTVSVAAWTATGFVVLLVVLAIFRNRRYYRELEYIS